MGEIKNKLNISKITIKNLFLVVLLMAVMAIIGAAAKLIGSRAANINTAQAQSCWTPPGGGGGGEGGGGEGSDVGGGGDGSTDSGCSAE
ncbi:hypothetical protein KKF25_03300 [Patescibacteria group bacterium]|nr:hypothetical protein [Patescibacteria group bacterium]